MFDPVFGNIPFVRRRSKLPVNPDIFRDIDYLLLSHDHFDHLDKRSIARLYGNNPGMKAFCGLGVGVTKIHFRQKDTYGYNHKKN